MWETQLCTHKWGALPQSCTHKWGVLQPFQWPARSSHGPVMTYRADLAVLCSPGPLQANPALPPEATKPGLLLSLRPN